MKYTIYHLVANQGGRYTKHIYIGGERVVSKIGDFASYGPDPRRIEYAGSEADAITVDLPTMKLLGMNKIHKTVPLLA